MLEQKELEKIQREAEKRLADEKRAEEKKEAEMKATLEATKTPGTPKTPKTPKNGGILKFMKKDVDKGLQRQKLFDDSEKALKRQKEQKKILEAKKAEQEKKALAEAEKKLKEGKSAEATKRFFSKISNFQTLISRVSDRFFLAPNSKIGNGAFGLAKNFSYFVQLLPSKIFA